MELSPEGFAAHRRRDRTPRYPQQPPRISCNVPLPTPRGLCSRKQAQPNRRAVFRQVSRLASGRSGDLLGSRGKAGVRNLDTMHAASSLAAVPPEKRSPAGSARKPAVFESAECVSTGRIAPYPSRARGVLPWVFCTMDSAGGLTPPCGSGGIGRRAGLRILWPKGRGGSTPSFRTNLTKIHAQGG